ncbi:restriction endonuclease subunit S [Psychrobacillus sp. FSL K6-2836]|uniref:restriction endonuclease subunit S n=1 Tax=Psychrobacillus sp. FSL K6-2836 TaxID=2921548 RepID=UPI0030F788A7
MDAPKLRFKGFNEEWQKAVLSHYLSFNNGINADKDSYGHGRKFINVLDILNNNYIKYEDIVGSVSVPAKLEESNKVEFGDILFLRSSETREDVGKSSVYLDKDKYALFGGFVIRGKKLADYHPYFLKLNLESFNVRNQIGAKAGGSTRYNISQAILSSVEIKMPLESEQTKIADFLTLLDKKMQKQQEKVELLKLQKKGLMQKIFSQKLRFKNENGREYPEWRMRVKAKDLFQSVSDKSHDGTLEVLSASQDQGILPRNLLNRKMQFASNNLVNYKRVRVNEFIISLRSFEGGIETSSYDGLVSPAYTVFKISSPENIEVVYFKYFFKTKNFITRLNNLTYGIRDGKAISYTDFSEMKFDIPSIEEQRVIVNFLSKIDMKVEKEKFKLNFLKEQKKAFMQQMFI